MRKGPLLVASVLAALALTAQMGPWRGVNVNRAGVSDATNITFAGTVTGGQFVGDGSRLTGISGGTNWYSTLTSTGRTMIGWLQGPVLASNCTFTVIGSPWHFFNQVQFYGESSWLRATNALNRIGGDGRWLYNLPQETNWWAVFEIPNEDDRWFDFTLKASTNGFATDFLGGDSKVFIYTTAEPALNGTPAWERFETNWYPRVFYYFDHDYNHLSVWNPNAVNPNGTSSIHDFFDAEPGVLNPPVVKWVVMLKAQGPVNPTNWLSWAYLRQSNTDSEVTPAEGRAYWRATVPTWVTYDPRPRLHPGHPFYPTLTNQHQRP